MSAHEHISFHSSSSGAAIDIALEADSIRRCVFATEHGGVRLRACGGTAELEEMLFLSRRSEHWGDETWMNNCVLLPVLSVPGGEEVLRLAKERTLSFVLSGLGLGRRGLGHI